MKRSIMAIALVLAVPAVAVAADAEPKRYALSATVQPGEAVTLAVGAVPRGQFAWSVSASSEAQKNFVITQKRLGKKAFTVLRVPNQAAYSACQGGSSAIYGPGPVACGKLTTPAVIKSRYTFQVRNLGTKPLKVGLVIKWKRLGSAG